jgi:prophage regulatory protein
VQSFAPSTTYETLRFTMRQQKKTPVIDEQLVTTKELLARVPLNRSTIWRMEQEGRFPPSIQITSNRKVWRWSTVLKWLAEREANPITPRTYFGRDKKERRPSTAPRHRRGSAAHK